MTSALAKQDTRQRLHAFGIEYDTVTARTVSFEGLGYTKAVFVHVKGAKNLTPELVEKAKEGIRKPSDGGYILKFI
jgi:hypothetical protein